MRFRPEIDYYEILQVHPRASQEMVRKAYRTLMGEMRAHPDLGGDEAQAKLINEAYTVLGDPEVRGAYDRARSTRTPWSQTGGAGERGFPGAAGTDLERLAGVTAKVLLSAVVIVTGVMLARLLRSPTLNVADLLAMLFFLFRIWKQVSFSRGS
jgi:hypothetical protein